MSFTEAIILALLQGLTEFLPVSSSGHLALAQALLGPGESLGADDVFYDVLLHVATMASVMAYFRRELWGLRVALGSGEDAARARRVVALIVTCTLPTGVLGLLLRHVVEHAFGVPALVGAGLLATSVLLALTVHLLRKRAGTAPEEEDDWLQGLAQVRFVDAFVIGIVQGLATWPGVSRSGSTIAAATVLGVAPVTAARFSLLASLPAIAGAFVLKAADVPASAIGDSAAAWLAGSAVAVVVGYLAIGWLVRIVRSARLLGFAAYTAALGLTAILLAVMN